MLRGSSSTTTIKDTEASKSRISVVREGEEALGGQAELTNKTKSQ